MDDWDVAIVGAGVIGLSVARELRRAGVERIALFEREASSGRGSSSRANGGVRAQFTTPINISFSLYSIEEIERLSEAHGESLSFRQNGYLLFTDDDGRAEGLRRAARLQSSLGVDTKWISASEVADRAPIVRIDGIAGATWHARDGYLDPNGLVAVMEKEARALGASLMFGAAVSSLTRLDGVFELEAGGRLHRASWVVNAAGPHAAEVAGLLDVDLPVQPVRRNLAFLRAASGRPLESMPMCVDLDTGVLVRREGRDGYVIAYSDPGDQPGWDTSLDPRWLDEVAARIGHRFPELEGQPIHPKHCWAGLYPETPDGHAIIGEARAAPKFVQCAGFGGHGLMHSPAAGKAVAELIVNGRCDSFDLHPLRPARFEEGDLVHEAAVL